MTPTRHAKCRQHDPSRHSSCTDAPQKVVQVHRPHAKMRTWHSRSAPISTSALTSSMMPSADARSSRLFCSLSFFSLSVSSSIDAGCRLTLCGLFSSGKRAHSCECAFAGRFCGLVVLARSPFGLSWCLVSTPFFVLLCVRVRGQLFFAATDKGAGPRQDEMREAEVLLATVLC